jgi:CheY-like chemotaxis protein
MRFIDDVWPVVAGEGPVLIVSDSLDGTVSKTVAERFAHDGHVVQVASDTREALELCEQRDPALIALGYISDDADAVRFLQTLRDRFDRSATKVCVITGTWRHLEVDGDIEPVVAISPSFTLSELLDITQQLLAA